MINLKYILKIVGTQIQFTVLHMNENFRCKEKDSPIEYTTCNGFKIKSFQCPAVLNSNVIYLRGEKKINDNVVATVSFNTEEEVILFATEMRLALEDWSKNCPDIKQDSTFRYYMKDVANIINGCDKSFGKCLFSYFEDTGMVTFCRPSGELIIRMRVMISHTSYSMQLLYVNPKWYNSKSGSYSTIRYHVGKDYDKDEFYLQHGRLHIPDYTLSPIMFASFTDADLMRNEFNGIMVTLAEFTTGNIFTEDILSQSDITVL